MSERTWRARISEGIGRADLLELGERVGRLETAVGEERGLLDALERQVTDLERSLVPVLEAPGDEGGGG